MRWFFVSNLHCALKELVIVERKRIRKGWFMILGIRTKDRDFLPDNYSNRTFEM